MFTLNHKTILITGGTGSFGQTFIEVILKRFPRIKELIVYSRDEAKLSDLSKKLSSFKTTKIKYFLGDIRDYKRLLLALTGVEIVIHAAALKHVNFAENNPIEAIKTNILGAENLVNACAEANVRKVVSISTDKAVRPVNLYGATKFCADKLIIAANSLYKTKKIKFSIVRYGNVMGSRGSILPFFLKRRESGTIPITHPDMTRFHTTNIQAVDSVLFTLQNMWGGEIVIPKIPSYRIMDLIRAIDPKVKIKTIGIQPGEKLHEDLISPADSFQTIELKKYFIILPSFPPWNKEKYIRSLKGKPIIEGTYFNSFNNDVYLSINELKREIKNALCV